MAKGFKKAPYKKAVGTSLQGYVDTTYRKLVSVFGKATKGDGYKTDAEWIVQFSDGTIATVYNYKDGKNYNGKDGLPLSKIRDWHIGGRSKRAVTLVKAALR